MAVSKLTHASTNIFMEQSFNDCLCNLGSTGTLASPTAPSCTFPTPFPANPTCRLGLPVPAGTPGTHTRDTHGNIHCSSHLPTTLPTRAPALGPPEQTCAASRAAAFCPPRCLAVSRGHFNSKPLLTVLLSEQKVPNTRLQLCRDQGHTAASTQPC